MVPYFFTFASLMFVVSVTGGDFPDVLTSLKSAGSCSPNVLLLNSNYTKPVDDCNFKASEKDLEEPDYAKYLLCVVYYDMNARLCNNSRLFETSLILRNHTLYNQIVNDKELDKDFCNQAYIVLNTVIPFYPSVKQFITEFTKEFLNRDSMCHKICYNWMDTDVLPICKSILLGNSIIKSNSSNSTVDNNTSSDTKSPKELHSELLINEPLDKNKSIQSNATVYVSNGTIPKLGVNNIDKADSTKSAPISQKQHQVSNIENEHSKNGNSIPAQKDSGSNPNLGNNDLKSNVNQQKTESNVPTKVVNSKITQGDEPVIPQNVVDPINTQDDDGDNTGSVYVNEDQHEDSPEDFGGNVMQTPIQDKEILETNEDSVINQPKDSPDVNEVKPEEKHLFDDQISSTVLKHKLVYPKDFYSSPTENHFYTVFFTVVALSVVIYVIYHNKNKILGLLIEGRSKGDTRRSSSGPAYRRLDNLEQVVSSGVKTPPSNVIY